MEKAINLFIVGTSYQYISAVNLCLERFKGNEFENHIFYLQNPRLEITDPNAIPELNGSIKPVNPKGKINFYKGISKHKYSRFFFFQENSIFNKFAAFHLKKRGTTICLGPDGLKPYGVFKKNHEFLSIVKDTIKDYKILFQNKMLIRAIILSRYYKYGSTFLIDEIYVQNRSLFNPIKNHSKGRIIELPKLKNTNVLKIAQTMGFDNLKAKMLSRNIIYFNQPFWSDGLVEQEITILKEILKKNPERILFVKLHPSTPKETRLLYSGIEHLSVIDDKSPAEFYLANSSNSIFISGWSTALMHNLGENNKYYYLYPIFKKLGDQILDQITIISFDHINVISNIGHLDFSEL